MSKVRLSDGYDVFLTQRQLAEVVSSSGGRATKLFRALLGVFFDPFTLAKSSALGSKMNGAFDRDILEASVGTPL